MNITIIILTWISLFALSFLFLRKRIIIVIIFVTLTILFGFIPTIKTLYIYPPLDIQCIDIDCPYRDKEFREEKILTVFNFLKNISYNRYNTLGPIVLFNGIKKPFNW